MTDKWSCQHFSLANPLRRGATDLPKLLRRVATEIEKRDISPMDLLDLTIHQEMTGDGPWWSATVYWSPDSPADDGLDKDEGDNGRRPPTGWAPSSVRQMMPGAQTSTRTMNTAKAAISQCHRKAC